MNPADIRYVWDPPGRRARFHMVHGHNPRETLCGLLVSTMAPVPGTPLYANHSCDECYAFYERAARAAMLAAPPAPLPEQCGTCAYFMRDPFEGAIVQGACRRYPPPSRENNGHPRRLAEDWCGEYRRAGVKP